jgi:hypothetical protein
MIHASHWTHSLKAWAPSLLVIVLSLGLTGCYTQLQTADRGASAPDTRQAETRTPAEAVQKKKPQYAAEYRREYRDGPGVRYDEYAYDAYGYEDDYEYLYEYKYKYKYGAPYRYRTYFDDWYHDPFFHDPFYRSGARFSLSFHFGSPFYAYHHRPWRYSSWHRYGYSPFGPRYYTNNYYYFDDDHDDDIYGGRTYRPRGGTVGQSTDGSVGRAIGSRDAAAARRAASQTTDTNGRIGRSVRGSNRDDTPRRATTGRASSDQPRSGRVGRATRPNRPENDRGSDRTVRTRETERTPERRTGRRSGRDTDGDRNRARTNRARADQAARPVTRAERDAREINTAAPRFRRDSTGRLRSEALRRAPTGRIGPARTSRIESRLDLDQLRRDQLRYEQLRKNRLRERRERSSRDWTSQSWNPPEPPRTRSGGQDRSSPQRSTTPRAESSSSDDSSSRARGSRSSGSSDNSDRGGRRGRSNDDGDR